MIALIFQFFPFSQRREFAIGMRRAGLNATGAWPSSASPGPNDTQMGTQF
jgi:hypothetical protein